MTFLLVNKNILHNRLYVPFPCITCICAHKTTQNFAICGKYANCTKYLICIAYFLGFHSIHFFFFSFPSVSIIAHCFLLFRRFCILQKT